MSERLPWDRRCGGDELVNPLESLAVLLFESINVGYFPIWSKIRFDFQCFFEFYDRFIQLSHTEIHLSHRIEWISISGRHRRISLEVFKGLFKIIFVAVHISQLIQGITVFGIEFDRFFQLGFRFILHAVSQIIESEIEVNPFLFWILFRNLLEDFKIFLSFFIFLIHSSEDGLYVKTFFSRDFVPIFFELFKSLIHFRPITQISIHTC